jgi:hypothetical protein
MSKRDGAREGARDGDDGGGEDGERRWGRGRSAAGVARSTQLQLLVVAVASVGYAQVKTKLTSLADEGFVQSSIKIVTAFYRFIVRVRQPPG